MVAATGTGKTLISAFDFARFLKTKPNATFLFVAHREEILKQAHAAYQGVLKNGSFGEIWVGNYSPDHYRQLFVSIQTLNNQLEKLKLNPDYYDYIIIDEVHLVGDNDSSMYGQFLHGITELNQKARLVGLTATPFRTGEGVVCGPDKLFQNICYESQTGRLIEEGFLCPITNKPAEATVDTSGIKVRGGEFIAGDAERAFDTDRHVQAACLETVEKCRERHSILVFAAGVTHAEHI